MTITFYHAVDPSWRISQGVRVGHVALDFACPTGTPCGASIEGEIAFAGWSTVGYGNLVIVQSGEWEVYLAHLSQIRVSVGQHVTHDTVIGLTGSTGNSTGPHLHYEIRKNNHPVDPRPLLAAWDEPDQEPQPAEPLPEIVIPAIEKLPQAKVLGTPWVNLRSKPVVKPSTDIGNLAPGTVVDVIKVKRSGNDIWLRIGFEQWVAMRYQGHVYMEFV